MKAVFLGGSRSVTRLSPEVRRRIDELVDQRLPILVGDANGADKAFQRYLAGRQYRHVTVFCSGDRCRNNLADWPAKRIIARRRSKDFEFYTAKDREMALEAALGLMIWDGKSLGTALNVARMVRQHKRVELYEGPAKRSVLNSDHEWLGLLRERDTSMVERLEGLMAREPALASAETQTTLPFAEAQRPDSHGRP